MKIEPLAMTEAEKDFLSEYVKADRWWMRQLASMAIPKEYLSEQANPKRRGMPQIAPCLCGKERAG